MKKYFVIILTALVLGGCTNDQLSGLDPEEDPNKQSASLMHEWIDKTTEELYLYGEDYKEMQKNYSLDYDSYFYGILSQMKAANLNELDGKSSYLYSYILRTDASRSSSSDNFTKASLASNIISYGISSYVYFVDDESGENFGVGICGVYKDSPAWRSGLRRGDIVNEKDFESWSMKIMEPKAGKTLSFEIYPRFDEEGNLDNSNYIEFNLVAESISPNPVLVDTWLTNDFISESDKVAYICYESFQFDFLNELLQVVDKYRDAKELILDLRLNGGGYVNVANSLATALKGSQPGEVFTYYKTNEFNKENPNTYFRNYEYVDELGFFKSDFLNYRNQAHFENLQRVYVLTSGRTASASEMIINSLQGIDFEVITIGEVSEGKNSGMLELSENFDNYTYMIAPLSFQSLNSKLEGDYYEGIQPKFTINEYLDFRDFVADEPLIKAALNHIETGSFDLDGRSRSNQNIGTQRFGFSSSSKVIGTNKNARNGAIEIFNPNF